MDKQHFFISGLPRSGSTLLCNILNQNSDVYASPTSGLFHVVKPTVNGWAGVAEFKANSTDENRRGILKGMIEGYYDVGESKDKKYIFDKSRAWPSEIELLKFIFGKEPKLIITVRDIRDVLSSMEKIYRHEKGLGKAVPGELNNPAAFQTMKSRFEFWSGADGLIGSSFNVVRDATARGLSKNMYFFVFEKWTADPVKEFKNLYEWLDIPNFKHDFDNVKQTIEERDEFYGYTSLHSIKEGKVEPATPSWPAVMDEELAKIYESSNFWQS